MTAISRRDALRWGGLGVLGLLHPGWSVGCGREYVASELVFDPSRPWWMQHNFAPVPERDATVLEVTGSIPSELDGIYLRNGANPKLGDSRHWFLGNGMAHAVRLQGGRALWYRGRYVRTPMLDRASNEPPPLDTPMIERDASNVSFVRHAGRLFSLGEIGQPVELSPADLTTLGRCDFDGKLIGAMTAHPKIDPVSGHMLMFGYGSSAPLLRFHEVDAAGLLARSVPLDLPAPVMMHDFLITASKVVFLDLSVTLDLAQAVANAPLPYRWNAEHQARIGIMPRSGSTSVTWLPIDPCFVFHGLNAYDDEAGNVVLEVCRYHELWPGDSKRFDFAARLYRYTCDPAAGSVELEQLDDRGFEFPRIDPRRVGLVHRFGYLLESGEPAVPVGTGIPAPWCAIVKLDRRDGSISRHAYPASQHPGEAVFVPARPDAGEDEGYLLTLVYDLATERASLHILDATRITAPPIAEVKLPFRVPYGFHGEWVSA